MMNDNGDSGVEGRGAVADGRRGTGASRRRGSMDGTYTFAAAGSCISKGRQQDGGQYQRIKGVFLFCTNLPRLIR